MNTIPQTKTDESGYDYRIFSTNPTEQIRALYQMRDEADEAYAFWQQQARCLTGTARHGALQNAYEACQRGDYADAAIRQLGGG